MWIVAKIARPARADKCHTHIPMCDSMKEQIIYISMNFSSHTLLLTKIVQSLGKRLLFTSMLELTEQEGG